MKRYFRRCTALLLLLLLLLSAFSACADTGTAGTTDTPTEAPSDPLPSTPAGTEEAPSETPSESSERESQTTEEPLPTYSDTESEKLPQPPETDDKDSAVNCENYLYKAYVRGRIGSVSFPTEDFWVSKADPSDAFDYAIYQRNLSIEDDYNCRIKQVVSTTDMMYDEMKTFYLDGETHELAILLPMGALACQTAGLLRDLRSMDHIKLENQAYDQNSLESFTLNGKLHMLSGDMNTATLDNTAVTVYNIALHSAYDFEALLGNALYNDLHETVRRGEWTVDAMLAMANAVSADKDKSGGVLDAVSGDSVGYFQYSASAQYYFYSCGATVASKDADGSPTIVFHKEKAKEVFDFLFERLNTASKHPDMPLGGFGAQRSAFHTNRVLFTDILLRDVRKVYRDAGYSYGILPTPKMSSAQERYFDVVYYPYQTSSFWTIPTVCENAEYASVLFHAMATYSAKPLGTMEAFLLSLIGSTERNRAAAYQSMKTVKESTVYDIDLLYDFGGFITQAVGPLSTEKENLYSLAATEENVKKAEENLQQLLQNLKNPSLPQKNEYGLVFELQGDGTYAVTNCTDEDMEEIIIPDSFQGRAVTKIGYNAFAYRAKTVKRIRIPDSVTSIGANAFAGCSALTDINLPEGITEIEGRAFAGCEALTSITLPTTLSFIGYDAFYGCKNLSVTALPESLTYIGDKAFYLCRLPSDLTIPKGMTSIGERAFYGCFGLASLTIPTHVTSIGKEAFSGCPALTAVIFEDTAGWALYANVSDEQPITSLTEDRISDHERAATVLRVTYSEYLWKRTEEA